MSDGIRCIWMRGGTSKRGYFLSSDLPADTAARDAFLLRVMGSPDDRQIDGLGGVRSTDLHARIDGIPGPSALIPIAFLDAAGSSCGALLPTGNAVDAIECIEATLIDTGMPCVVMRAADLGIGGEDEPKALEETAGHRTKLEAIRLKAGPMMNLGDVADKSVPKMTMVSVPKAGRAISTLTFIPHRCHSSIGVLGAVSVAKACLLPGSPAADLVVTPVRKEKTLSIEHPTGEMTVLVSPDANGDVQRTARKLFDGVVFGN